MKDRIPVLERMLTAVLGDAHNVTISFEDEAIQLCGGHFTIYETEIAVKSIRGEVKVPGYGLGKSVYVHGGHWEPDYADLAELSEQRNFELICKDAILAIIEERIIAHLDFLSTEEQAKELFG